MPTQQDNDPRQPLLSIATPTSGLRKTLTSVSRHQRTEIIAALYLALLFLGCLSPIAAELSKSTTAMEASLPKLTQRLLRDATTDPVARDERCKSCQLYRHTTSEGDVTTPTSRAVSRLLRAQVKRLARGCGLTYEQYRRLCRPTEPQDKVTSRLPRDASVTSLTEKLLSRKRRLAGDGDIRTRRLSSNTGYYLEISPDGSVRGSSTPTIYTKLKIEAVHAGGVVRIFGTESNKYLAMTDDGYLYGSSAYNPTACNFVEVVQSNYFNTYHSLALPNGWRRRRRNRQWFVAIGKTGRPRKGSSARADLPSSWFLPHLVL